MTDKAHFKVPKLQIQTANLDAIFEFRKTANYIPDYVRTIDHALAGLRDYFNRDFLGNHEALMKSIQGWADAMQGTVKNPAAKKALRERGILPHKSTPWNLFEPDMPDEFPDAVLSHYSTEWDQARAMFLTDLDGYQIGEEAKEAYIEGIECHTSNLYRPAILTVLPAAETEFRRNFDIAPGKPAASLRELREAIMEAPVGVILSHVAPFDLFETLDKHLYERVQSQEDVARLATDPIPNRHAAIHGLIQYKSELNSLNALILTDYVFFVISQIADYLGPVE